MIILPNFHLDLLRYNRTGTLYVSVSDVIGLLYKGAAEAGQDSVVAEAFTHLAEAFEKDVIQKNV